MSLRAGKLCQIAGAAGVLLALGIALYGLATVHVTRMPQPINCVNNLKQIGLAFKTWAIDYQDHFPFNASTNAGGTLELCARNAEGFDSNAFLHFRVMSNELATPMILACPKDISTKPAPDFASLGPQNVTYRMRSGTNVSDFNPQEVLAVCPVHHNVLHCDGSVTEGGRDHAGMWEWIRIYWRYEDSFRQIELCAFGGFGLAVLLVFLGTWLKHSGKESSKCQANISSHD